MKIRTGLENYYGEVEFMISNGKYWMRLENWSGWIYVEISIEFYEAARKEFTIGWRWE